MQGCTGNLKNRDLMNSSVISSFKLNPLLYKDITHTMLFLDLRTYDCLIIFIQRTNGVQTTGNMNDHFSIVQVTSAPVKSNNGPNFRDHASPNFDITINQGQCKTSSSNSICLFMLQTPREPHELTLPRYILSVASRRAFHLLHSD